MSFRITGTNVKIQTSLISPQTHRTAGAPGGSDHQTSLGTAAVDEEEPRFSRTRVKRLTILLHAYLSEETGSQCNDPEAREVASVCIPSARLAVPLGDRDSSLTRTADRKYASLPASCDRWTAGRRSPWPRRFSRPHREFSARLGRPPPWQRGTRCGLPAVSASGARSGRPGRSSLGPAPAAAPRVPTHAGEARGEVHLAPVLRELGPPGAASATSPRPVTFPRPVTSPQPAGLCTRCLCRESRTAGVPLPPAFSSYIRPARAPHDRELQLPDRPALLDS